MEKLKGEKLKKETTTQKIYFFHDTENKIEQKSRIVYKKKDLIVHFPRGYKGGDKYRTIKKFSFHGFKGKLPVGIIKSVNYGYGFTKGIGPFAYFVNDNFDIEEVIVQKKGKTELDIANKKLYLSDNSLQKLSDSFSLIFKKNRA